MVKRWAMLEAMNTNSIYNSLDYRKDHKEDGQQKIVEGGQVPCQELRLVLPLHLLQHEVLGCVHLLGQQGQHQHHSCQSQASFETNLKTQSHNDSIEIVWGCSESYFLDRVALATHTVLCSNPDCREVNITAYRMFSKATVTDKNESGATL